ncbi:unnamed protein product [Adineta steineri]|nr:unnamed protein product [Adineta steineri]
MKYKVDSICDGLCRSHQECLPIINRECPSMFNIPTIPILFRDIYFAYEKNDSIEFARGQFPDPYICYNNLLYDDYFTDSEMLPFNGRKCYRFYSSELPAKIDSYIIN